MPTTKPRFLVWHHNLRIVLKHEKICYILEYSFTKTLVDDSTKEEVVAIIIQ